MNIHFSDVVLFESLKSAALTRVKVGSHMYGTNDKCSDIDYLYIYATSKNEMLSCIDSHHQLQYKEEGIDHNFVSLHVFLKNILSGDSTINFEVLHSDDLIGSELSWLKDHKNSFLTYNIMRSYLGLARRDLKFYNRYHTERERKKRLGHVIRGVMYANSMLNGDFNFTRINSEFRDLDIDVSNDRMFVEYTEKVDTLRSALNRSLESGGLSRNISFHNGMRLNNDLKEFCCSDIFIKRSDILVDFDMSLYINAFENWVEYNK